MIEEYIVQVTVNGDCINNGLLTRCADCKHWDLNDGLLPNLLPGGIFKTVHNCGMVGQITFEDEYCCWAKRK